MHGHLAHAEENFTRHRHGHAAQLPLRFKERTCTSLSKTRLLCAIKCAWGKKPPRFLGTILQTGAAGSGIP